MIIILDNLALYIRLLVSPGQLIGCHVSCSFGKNVGAVIHLFEHFPSSDQLSVAGVAKV